MRYVYLGDRRNKDRMIVAVYRCVTSEAILEVFQDGAWVDAWEDFSLAAEGSLEEISDAVAERLTGPLARTA